jgi:hypothetical protein
MATMNVLNATGGTETIEKPMSVENNALLTSILAAVDGLETLITATNTALGVIDGRVDGLEALIGTTNTTLSATNTALTAANASLDNIEAAALDTTTDSPVTVHQPADVINYVPVLDTAAYAAGDVLAATAVISNVMRANDGRANLLSLTGIDKSKQKPAMTILFYQTNVTSAAANAANAMSDADQLNLLGFHRILAADWIDYANNSICCFKGPDRAGAFA